MQRPVLNASQVHPALFEKMASYHAAAVTQVQAATREHDVVVVGMTMNPFPRRACNLLDSKGVAYQYLGFGSYVSQWKPRLAIKLWTGWPTFPQIFVKGTLVGGYTDLKRLTDNGELQRLLGAPQTTPPAAVAS